MPDVIKLLPDAIANQIAAGEVIQRPASAVKELLENAIDAGATDIRLVIKEAGKNLIQVIDNGCGMSPTDARMSFERHATSKIRKSDDLFHIRTMGFRGEALASVAAIARVELKSRRPEDEVGTEIFIEASEVKRQEPCQMMPGTSIAIRNLFFNTPARRQFLKSDNVEMRHIIDEFQRVALAFPQLSFSLFHNSMELFNLPPGTLRKRIIKLFGNPYNERLVPVDESTEVVKISGFIGKPEFARKTRGEQYFFVNRRFIKSPYLHHAIRSAFDELLPEKAYPLYVIFLQLDPGDIDINVHPTKQEVKFQNERIVYAYLQSAVKRALGKYSVTPSLDFENEAGIEKSAKWIEAMQEMQSMQPPPENRQRDEVYNPFYPEGRQPRKDPDAKWKDYFESGDPESGNPAPDDETITVPSGWDRAGQSDSQAEIVPVQIHGSYILATIKGGLILLDQQAAHERILYERFHDSLEKNKGFTQKQLFPVTIHLNTQDTELLRSILDDVNALGFDLQHFGDNDFVIHGLPADIEGINEKEVIEGLLEQYKAAREALRLDKRELLARAMSRQMAIKRGKKLSPGEMRALIDELFACRDYLTAPNGNRTFIKYSLEELQRQFEKKR